MKTEGKAVIFSAPSGAGKTTIVHQLLSSFDCLEFSISACNRPKRVGEIDGRDYYFLTTDDFKQKISSNDFLEWEEVYANSFYGTLKSELNRIWSKGNVVLFDVDVLGGINIKKQLGEKALSIFVMPPSIEILEERLRNRSTETEESLQKRLGKAEIEISYANQFDTIIINDNLDIAVENTSKIIKEFLQ